MWVPVCPKKKRARQPSRGQASSGDAAKCALSLCRTRRDVTAQLTTAADRRVSSSRGSTSRLHPEKDRRRAASRGQSLRFNEVPEPTGRGLFAAALTRAFPMLPVEEEGRLGDPRILERFLVRVFAHSQLALPKELSSAQSIHAPPR